MSNFKTAKIRSKKHLKWVAAQASILSGLPGEVAHHLLGYENGKGLGMKVCDTLTVSLTNLEHRMLHACGDEVVFFENHGLDYEVVKKLAANFCKESPCDKVREA